MTALPLIEGSFTGRPDQVAVLGRTAQLQERPNRLLGPLPPSVAHQAKLTNLTHKLTNLTHGTDSDAFSSEIGAGARRPMR
jgi:hypothetical protein